MQIQKIILALSTMAVLGLNISCAKTSGDEESLCGEQACSERDLNAPVDGIDDQAEQIPEVINPPPTQGQARSYSHIDPNNLIADKPLALALAYYDANYDKIVNKNYVTVIDFTKNASKKRMFLIDMKTGAVTAMLTSAGKGSDPDGDGNATLFSNVPESRKSSLGYYITGKTYQGGNGLSLYLHGMSTTNSNAYQRLIVVHGANYVNESDSWAGRSAGCPAVDHSLMAGLTAKIKGGSVMYAYHANYSTERL